MELQPQTVRPPAVPDLGSLFLFTGFARTPRLNFIIISVCFLIVDAGVMVKRCR